MNWWLVALLAWLALSAVTAYFISGVIGLRHRDKEL